eukprot:snap_masked-scaffold_2-processed-gene-7.29-mRNA-1 protein AED:1.00 eAED:1.00 QI:0/-1/0/0/-1/1/1/0/403
MVLLKLFSILFIFFQSAFSLECFQSCFPTNFNECDVDETSPCNGKCGSTQSPQGLETFLPAFVLTNCSSKVDTCTWVETLVTRANGALFTLSFPFGCLDELDLQVLSSNLGQNILLSEGVNVFTCEGNLCNDPPSATGCNEDAAREYTSASGQNVNSACFVTNSEFTSLRSSPFRRTNGQGTNLPDDRRSHCVDLNEEEVEELSIRRVDVFENNTDIGFTLCSECRETQRCGVDENLDGGTLSPTPEPASTASPTTDEVDAPESTKSPTLGPTESPNPEEEEQTQPNGDSEEEVDVEDILVYMLPILMLLVIVLIVFLFLQERQLAVAKVAEVGGDVDPQIVFNMNGDKSVAVLNVTRGVEYSEYTNILDVLEEQSSSAGTPISEIKQRASDSELLSTGKYSF